MKCKMPCPGFKLRLPIPFPMITIPLNMARMYVYIYIYFKILWYFEMFTQEWLLQQNSDFIFGIGSQRSGSLLSAFNFKMALFWVFARLSHTSVSLGWFVCPFVYMAKSFDRVLSCSDIQHFGIGSLEVRNAQSIRQDPVGSTSFWWRSYIPEILTLPS